MPIRTGSLDRGNFVRNPEFTADAGFAAYLRGIDSLLAMWQQAYDAWQESPFVPQRLELKQQLNAELDEYIAAFGSRYTITCVEQDPRFLTLANFFARSRPIRGPFAILHCDARLPLHTVASFADAVALDAVNAALSEDTPLRWWQDGPLGHPYYLFGEHLWELKPSELGASDKGLEILFLDMAERERQRCDRLRSGILSSVATADCALIPAPVRTTVFRRDRGKCARCGGRQGLDFEFIIPPSKGGTASVKNIHLLCTRCATRS